MGRDGGKGRGRGGGRRLTNQWKLSGDKLIFTEELAEAVDIDTTWHVLSIKRVC